MTLRSVVLDEIRIDGGTQPRAAISEMTVSEYAAAMHDGVQLPPMDLFFDGSAYWLADGFHRYHAARHLGLESVAVTVHAGTRRDAVLFAVGSNQAHGLRRTNEDKRRAVLTLLNDEEWTKWSDSEIGRRCGVAHTLVGDCRRGFRRPSADGNPSHVPGTSEPRTYTTKHGTEATMNTEQIGRKREPATSEPAPQFKSRAAVEQRKEQMRTMAANGYSSPQIAQAIGVTVEGCRQRMRDLGIDVPADRAVGRGQKHDSTRILETIVMDAENLMGDVNLIAFGELDHARFPEWVRSLKSSRDRLGEFIRRLQKEQQNVSAA